MVRKLFLFLLSGVALTAALTQVSCNRYVYKRLDPKAPLVGNLEPAEGLTELSAKQCGQCHTEIFAEWQKTMHAKAWTDPLFQSDWADLERPYMCTYCHTPIGQQREITVTGLKSFEPVIAKGDPNPKFDAALQAEGVTCAACHLREGKIRSPFPIEEAEAPHAVVYAPDQGTPETCRYCHFIEQKNFTDLKRPLLDTFNEWDEYKKKGGDKMCLECHMPSISRPTVPGGPVRQGRQHVFRGGHDKKFVKLGFAILGAKASYDGKNLQASFTLENKTGHRFPTGEPARYVEISAEALDASGNVLATLPMQRIIRVVDEHGFKESSDNTILPLESRTFTLRKAFTAQGDKTPASLRLRLQYFIWDPATKVAKHAALPIEELSTVLYEQSLSINGDPAPDYLPEPAYLPASLPASAASQPSEPSSQP
jgi:hypothetical protein